MAYLWNRPSPAKSWFPQLLTGRAATLLPGATREADEGRQQQSRSATRVVLSCFDEDRWALITPTGSDVRVNAQPVLAGLKLLDDRDAIQVPGCDPVYLATRGPTLVQPCPDMARDVYCTRCSGALEPGCDAARCPDCGNWAHQHGELLCWTYGPTCAVCGYPTPLDGAFPWTPEDL